MRRALICAARRSIVAPRGGALSRLGIHELAAPVMLTCLADAGLRPDQVDEVILSNAMGGGGNPARLAALTAELPERVAGLSIDRQCVGGLDAVLLASSMIQSGAAEVVLAGGAESYSRRPIRMRLQEDGPPQPYDRPPFSPWPERDPDMADAADQLARDMGIARRRQDAWAQESHAKALAANLSAELVCEPFGRAYRDSYARVLSPRLCARAPVVSGSVTHANMAVAADGAAFLLVVSDRVAKQLQADAVEVLHGVTRGGPPETPGIAPVAAVQEVLAQAQISASQLSHAEIMEAFAVQAIACVEGANLPQEIINRKGGALARGHPIGASGAVLAVRLYHDLRESGRTGLAAIAAAGGLGTAALLRA